jgi:hypothetical protein
MSTFEYPIQRSDAPTSASIEPKLSQREQSEREGIQIDTVSGIGAAACDSVSCHLCEYYLRDAQPEVLDTGETPVNAFDRTEQMTTSTAAVDPVAKVSGIIRLFRQAVETTASLKDKIVTWSIVASDQNRKSDTADTREYFITSKSASDGSVIEVPISTDLYNELQNKRRMGQNRVEYLRAQIASHEKLLDYLNDYTHANIDTGEMEDKRGAMINLQFEIMGTIRGLEAKLVEVQYGGSLYAVDSSIVG